MTALMKEWPTRVRTARPPEASISSGTALDVMRLWITTGRSSPAARARVISRSATMAATADGETGSPFWSTTKQRSASPSNASPMSAPCSRTARCRSTRLAGSSGLAGWLGNVPSNSKYSGTISSGSGSSSASPSTAGVVSPAIPLPASTTTLRGRIPERSTRSRR